MRVKAKQLLIASAGCLLLLFLGKVVHNVGPPLEPRARPEAADALHNVGPPLEPRARSEPTDALLDWRPSSVTRVGDGVSRPSFAVFTDSCKIPEFDPWDASVRAYVRRGTGVRCSGAWDGADLTAVRDGVLSIVRQHSTATAAAPPAPRPFNVSYCAYKEVLRVDGTDDEYDYATDAVRFVSPVSLDKEFVKVTCYDADDVRLPYSNFYARVQPKAPAQTRTARQRTSKRFNVLLVGLDSVSRYNFARQFPATARLLTGELGAYELKGYTKVADNTFVNLMPLFVGQFADEAGWSEASREPFDDYPLAWRLFAERGGYRTLFAEDAPDIAIWNYAKRGFRGPPADHYYRPMALAMEHDGAASRMWDADRDCFGARSETAIVLDYASQFVRAYRDEPWFAFVFLTRATHSDVNKRSDDEHARFLGGLLTDGLLNDTVVVYFSDHGMRFGPIVGTYMGKIEERMPAMFVSVPPLFVREWPFVPRNLKLNENRLTTPFDVHATLMDLLGDSGEVGGRKRSGGGGARGISLFYEIPASRTCPDAGVLPHWCTCQLQTPVSVDDERVRAAARAVVGHVNALLAPADNPSSSPCVELRLESVVDALLAQSADDVLRFRASLNDVIDRRVYFGSRATHVIATYMVTVRTAPGGGLLVATLRYDEESGAFDVLGEVSRINAYGEQSACVEQHSLKKFCYCRRQL